MAVVVLDTARSSQAKLQPSHFLPALKLRAVVLLLLRSHSYMKIKSGVSGWHD